MIATIKTKRGKQTSTKSTFASLYQYITRQGEVSEVRLSSTLNPEVPIPQQMIALADEGTGRTRSTLAYHAIFSWNRDIESAEAFGTVARGLDALGVSNHQWIAALHRDAEHIHIHVLLNRIDPETKRAWRPWQDYRTLSKFSALETERERTRGLVPDPEGASLKNSRAGDMEAWTGQCSMERWAKRDLKPIVDEALSKKNPTWRATHHSLATFGVTLEKNDRGLILLDRSTKHKTRLSASAIGLSLSNLEHRLGPWKPAHLLDLRPEHGYGYRKERFDLPVPSISDPLIWPAYKSFMEERRRWKTSGHAASAIKRAQISKRLESTDREVENRFASVAVAAKQIPDVKGRAICEVVKSLHQADRQARKRARRAEMHAVSQRRPLGLWRSWLKERDRNGDAAAGTAVAVMRKGSLSSADLLKAAARIGIGMVDPRVQDWIDRYIAARRGGAPLPTSVDLIEVGRAVMNAGFNDQYMANLHEVEKNSPATEMPAICLGTAVVLMRGSIPEDQISKLYEPLHTIVPLEELERNTPTDTAAKNEEKKRVERQAQNASGWISPGTAASNTIDDKKLNAAVERYIAYVDKIGSKAYYEQVSRYSERASRLSAKHPNIPDNSPEGTMRIFASLRADAMLQDAYETERQTLENVTGGIEPMKFKEFLHSTFPKDEADQLTRQVDAIDDQLASKRTIGMNDRDYDKALALIIDTKATQFPDGSVGYTWKTQRGFIDRGTTIDIMDSNEKESAKISLLLAVAKYKTGITLNGSEIFVDNMLKAAVESGLATRIANPELQPRIAELTAQHELKTHDEKEHQNQTQKKPSQTRKKIDNLAPNLSPTEIKELADAEMVQALTAQIKTEHPEFTFKELESGTLYQIYMLEQQQFALIGNNNDVMIVPIGKEKALDLQVNLGQKMHVTQDQDLWKVDLIRKESTPREESPSFSR